MSSALPKTENIVKPAKATFWFTVTGALQKSTALILIPVYVRLMSGDDFGVYTIFQSWIPLIQIFATLNLSMYVFYNGMANYPSDREGYTTAALGLMTLLTVASFCVLFLFRPYWESAFGLSSVYVPLLLADSLFVSVYDLFASRKRYDFEYKTVSILSVVSSLGNFALGLLAVFLSPDKALAAIVVKVLIQLLLALYICKEILCKSTKLISKQYWKYMLRFNVVLVPHFLSLQLLQQIDKIMINGYLGSAAAGVYGFAFSIAMGLLFLNTALNNSLTPWTYRKLSDKNYRAIGTPVSVATVVVGCAYFLICLFTPEIVLFLGTDQYASAEYIIPPVALSAFMMFLFNLFVNVEYYYEKRHYVVVASSSAVIVSVAMNVLIIPNFGFELVGLKTFGCYVLMALGHFLAYKRVLAKNSSVKSIYNDKFLILWAMVVSVSGLAVCFLYESLLIRCILCVVLCAVAFSQRKRLRSYIRGFKD